MADVDSKQVATSPLNKARSSLFDTIKTVKITQVKKHTLDIINQLPIELSMSFNYQENMATVTYHVNKDQVGKFTGDFFPRYFKGEKVDMYPREYIFIIGYEGMTKEISTAESSGEVNFRCNLRDCFRFNIKVKQLFSGERVDIDSNNRCLVPCVLDRLNVVETTTKHKILVDLYDNNVFRSMSIRK